jgi:hypothetical protein
MFYDYWTFYGFFHFAKIYEQKTFQMSAQKDFCLGSKPSDFDTISTRSSQLLRIREKATMPLIAFVSSKIFRDKITIVSGYRL